MLFLLVDIVCQSPKIFSKIFCRDLFVTAQKIFSKKNSSSCRERVVFKTHFFDNVNIVSPNCRTQRAGRLFAPGCAVLERLSIHEKACEALMREQIIPWSLSSCVF